MGLAIQAVKSGEVGAGGSAGNTGALMAMASWLRTMPGIDRPALAALCPRRREIRVMLDLGANTECDARNLVQFAMMGAALCPHRPTGTERPRVRLLNIGTEDTKGTGENLQQAAQRLRDATGLALSFEGYVEADKINRGNVDVVVADGFSGNIALKAIEGSARFVTDLLQRTRSRSSLRSKIGFLVSRPAKTELLRHHLDPNNHNGAVFLGLNGVVVKSHGSGQRGRCCQCGRGRGGELLEESLTERITRPTLPSGSETRLRENGTVGQSRTSAK